MLRVVRDALRALGEVRAAVVVKLAARPAWAGVAHAPEVLLVAGRDVAPAHEPIGRQADVLRPDAVRFFVIGVDGRGDALWVDPEFIGQELPCPVDRLALEVVAERPVAEHLEEGLVAGSPADLLEVVVLAGDAEAGLGVDRAHVVTLLLAGEDAFERSHARVDEQQRRVVLRQQRRRRHARVPALLEEALETLADLGRAHRLHRSTCHSRRRAGDHRLSRCLLGGLDVGVTGPGPRRRRTR